MNKIELITIGADPELFLINDNNEGVPSEEYFKGDKNYPFSLEKELGKGFNILCDNVMVEYNIPPVINKEDFIDSNKKVLKYINEVTPDYIHIDISASKYFNKDKLQSKLARTFGCAEDYTVYDLSKINKVKASKNNTLRTAGGHLHIGYSNISMNNSINLIKLMDLYLGVPSILIDADTERRKMYGNAGSFRPKPYGFEYRTLSNFWLQNATTMTWVWNQIQKVFEKINGNLDFLVDEEKNIVKCINNQDFILASELCEKHNIELIEIIKKEKY